MKILRLAPIARTARRLTQPAAFGVFMACVAPATAQAANEQPACESMRAVHIPNVEIVVAKEIIGTFREDIVSDRGPRTYENLPHFCRVRGFARPVEGSEIGFEVWLPRNGWTGRLHMIGGDSYVSNISYEDMIPRLEAGDVAVGTDGGHQGSSLKFGWKKPEKITDFGHRAVHESVKAAKVIVNAFYGRSAEWSYFSGCSTGGYQGLSSSQRYPDDFDGIIAGAPGNNRTNLTLAFLWNYLANHRPGDDAHPILAKADLRLINRAVVEKCDANDGIVDGVVSEPLSCGFELSTLQCKQGEADGSCLNAEQIDAAKKIYAGPRHARTGQQIYPGYPLGTEGVLSKLGDHTPGWSGFWHQSGVPWEPSRADMFRYWVFDDPAWDWWDFDWADDVDLMRERLSADFDAVDPDLSEFADGDGKIIMFMGWQDPVGSPIEAINYYDSVEREQPGRSEEDRRRMTQEFLRLFMVPGMDHCSGGPGATAFSSAIRGSEPPIDDARHDMLLALYNWVERGNAPDFLIATKYAGTQNNGRGDERGKKAIAFQRPICVYPERPVYRGGRSEAAASYVCMKPSNGLDSATSTALKQQSD